MKVHINAYESGGSPVTLDGNKPNTVNHGSNPAGYIAFGSFECPWEDLFVGCTSTEIRFVSLTDPGLILYFLQEKKVVFQSWKIK